MALYYHVANKEEILDGIVDLVFREIERPSADGLAVGDHHSDPDRAGNRDLGRVSLRGPCQKAR
jgi:hypothetical protein